MAVHSRGRFGERGLLLGGGFLHLLKLQDAQGAVGCMGRGMKPLCSNEVRGGQLQGWDGEDTAGAAAGRQGQGGESHRTACLAAAQGKKLPICVPPRQHSFSSFKLHVTFPNESVTGAASWPRKHF